MHAAKTIIAAVVLAASFAGAAYARNEVATAKLVAPTEQTRVIADATLWSCSADTCLARPTHTATVRACRQFVREAGVQVTSYGTDERQLSADEIARCNGDQAQTQSAQN